MWLDADVCQGCGDTTTATPSQQATATALSAFDVVRQDIK